MGKKLTKCKTYPCQGSLQSFQLYLHQLQQRQQLRSSGSRYPFKWCSRKLQASPVQTSQLQGYRVLVLWIYLSFVELNCPQGAELPAGKLRQGGGQIVNVRCSPTEDQVPVIRITSIQSNVLLLDGKVQGVPVTVVVDCGSPICILSNEVFDCIGLGDTVGRVRSKLSSTRTKVWGSSVQQ